MTIIFGVQSNISARVFRVLKLIFTSIKSRWSDISRRSVYGAEFYFACFILPLGQAVISRKLSASFVTCVKHDPVTRSSKAHLFQWTAPCEARSSSLSLTVHWCWLECDRNLFDSTSIEVLQTICQHSICPQRSLWDFWLHMRAFCSFFYHFVRILMDISRVIDALLGKQCGNWALLLKLVTIDDDCCAQFAAALVKAITILDPCIPILDPRKLKRSSSIRSLARILTYVYCFSSWLRWQAFCCRGKSIVQCSGQKFLLSKTSCRDHRTLFYTVRKLIDRRCKHGTLQKISLKTLYLPTMHKLLCILLLSTPMSFWC